MLSAAAFAQGPENILLVVNDNAAVSKAIGEYYVAKRHVPLRNICHLGVKADEEIGREEFGLQIARKIQTCLQTRHLTEQVLYIVTTSGVPLRVGSSKTGPQFENLGTEVASVDSELTLLYSDMRTGGHQLAGAIPNPFFGKKDAAFRHADFPIYLVTRLTGYDFADVRGIIDRALLARNRGKFVIDLRGNNDEPGNDWLREAALALPRERVIFDDSDRVLRDEQDVIGYAGWGSNDKNRDDRHLGFHWLPGAIVTEYVSTNARTFSVPPAGWNIGTWEDHKSWFMGSPQTLTADYIHDGATGASGHVAEPFLQFTPRPNLLLPAYYRGRNLAESYYLAIPALSWMNVVIGDPLCALGKP